MWCEVWCGVLSEAGAEMTLLVTLHSCCLAGRAYPKGEIPLDIVHKVKVEVSSFRA